MCLRWFNIRGANAPPNVPTLKICIESECIIMARRTTTNGNKGNTPENFATAHFKGVVSSAYCDGKKYDYITIDVHHDYDDYYDRFRVAVNKDYEIPDDGEPIEIDCFVKSYKGDVTFKEIHADVTNK